MANRGILGAGGGFGTGLLLLVGGLIVKHAQANLLAECSSGLGQFGQAFDPNAAAECSSAQDLSSLATGAIWLGTVMLIIAIGGGIVFLVAAGILATNKSARAAALGTGSARPVKPAPGTPTRPPVGYATPQPAVPVGEHQTSSPTGPGCGHELQPGMRFCTVCGRPAAAEGPGIPVPQSAAGCGHELRLGARFCTVCGTAAAAGTSDTPASGIPASDIPASDIPASEITASDIPASDIPAANVPAADMLTARLPVVPRAAEPTVPAPRHEITVTALRPVPPMPDPFSPSSPATMPNEVPGRSYGGPEFSHGGPEFSYGGPGFDPPAGWAHSAPAPGGPPPPHDVTAPGAARRPRSRWPLTVGLVAVLVAGGVAAVVILQPFRSSQAAAGASPPSAPAPSASPTPSPSPHSPQQDAADALAALLAQSVSDRSSIVNAVNSVSQCGPTLSQDPQILQNAAASRHRLLAQLASLNGRSALPANMLAALASAWRASAKADQDFARWAQDELSQGCTPNDQSDPNFQAAAGPDGRATAGKQTFASLWNPMATQYGLTNYNWDQL
jgi:hypothetical protein